MSAKGLGTDFARSWNVFPALQRESAGQRGCGRITGPRPQRGVSWLFWNRARRLRFDGAQSLGHMLAAGLLAAPPGRRVRSGPES